MFDLGVVYEFVIKHMFIPWMSWHFVFNGVTFYVKDFIIFPFIVIGFSWFIVTLLDIDDD